MIYHFKIHGMEKNKPKNKKMTKKEIEFFAEKPMKKPVKKPVKKTPEITVAQLRNIDEDLRKIINDHIDKNQMSIHGFAKMCGIHPNQMYMFLKMDRGLNITTVQRIGEILMK